MFLSFSTTSSYLAFGLGSLSFAAFSSLVTLASFSVSDLFSSCSFSYFAFSSVSVVCLSLGAV